MDATINFTSIGSIVACVSVTVTAWLKIRKLNKEFKTERALESAKILQEAKEADSKMKSQWESKREYHLAEINSKMKALETRLDNLEESVSKDFAHVRETYNGEIRNLGDKIEDLRSELRSQHGQLVNLLSEMIKSRD